MLLLDVNVVVAAHRDDHVHYAQVNEWFEDVLAGMEPFAVPTLVWTSFLRLVTSRRVFNPPTRLEDAFAFIDAVCGQPHHLPVGPGIHHMTILRTLCEEVNAAGDLIPDAALAAIALEHDCKVASLDRDFARFSLVDRVVPGRT